MKSIKENLLLLRRDIEEICPEREVIIVAVTKLVEIDKIKEVIELGIRDVGENKVQEAERKFSHLKEYKIRYHMVGHLQKNKVKKAVRLFDLIHSVDSFQLVYEIDKEANKIEKIQDILLQVNISKEESKFGLSEKETLELIERIKSFKNISLKGLMTIAPFVKEEEILRECFRGLRRLKEDIEKRDLGEIKYLSMGMSNDYKIALEEGANMIRLGTFIFKEE
jgi:hypothetical protein